jgi:hypothetical protein
MAPFWSKGLSGRATRLRSWIETRALQPRSMNVITLYNSYDQRALLCFQLQGRSPLPFSRRIGLVNTNWNAETIIRISCAVVASAATPVLVGLASVRWIKGVRRELPPWRNGVGLASIVIVSAFWLFQMMRWLLLSMNRELTAPYGDWREYELFLPAFFVWPALLLACALKGSPRLLMIAAWVTVLFSGPFAYT